MRRWAIDPWQGISRSQKALKRMADGSLGGATNLASPVTPSGAALVVPTVVAAESGAIDQTVAYFGLSTSQVNSDTKLVWFEEFNYGGVFSLDGGSDDVSANVDAIVGVDIYLEISSGTATEKRIKVNGFDIESARRDERLVPAGEPAYLHLAFTERMLSGVTVHVLGDHDGGGNISTPRGHFAFTVKRLL